MATSSKLTLAGSSYVTGASGCLTVSPGTGATLVASPTGGGWFFASPPEEPTKKEKKKKDPPDELYSTDSQVAYLRSCITPTISPSKKRSKKRAAKRKNKK